MPAAKKAAPKKTAPRRRPAAKRAAPRKRRAPVKRAGIGLNLKDVGLAIAGGLLMDAYVDKLKIENPKMRYGVATVGSGVLAWKGPKELAPLFIGGAIVAGMKTVAVVFPKIMPGGGGDGLDKMVDTGKMTTLKHLANGAKTIGRLNAKEEAMVRKAVEARMGIQGRYSPVTGANQYSPVTGRPKRRYVR